MIIVINSMPKSASSLLRFYVREMIEKVNPAGQHKLISMIKQGKISGKGQFVSRLEPHIIDTLMQVSVNEGPIMIKVHLDYSSHMESWLQNPDILMTFNYRDPRDIVLSAMDHAKRAKQNGSEEFKDCLTFNNAVAATLKWSLNAVKWINSPCSHCIQYEYFLTHTDEVLSKVNFLAKFGLTKNDLIEIILHERDRRMHGVNQFNKGNLVRYTTEMTSDQLSYCNNIFAEVLPKLFPKQSNTN